MKKFLIKTGLFFLCLGIIISAWMHYSFNIEPLNPASYLYAHAIKLQRLDTLSSPRIVLVGGSNVAFGFDSRRIADSLKRNVQNMGLHASIGLRYTLSQTSRYIRPGDVIVILPEYEQFYNEYNGSGNIITEAFLNSPKDSWKELNLTQMVNIIDGFPMMEKCRRELLLNPPPDDQWTYRSKNFNQLGDETAHWTATPPEFKYAISKFSLQPDSHIVDDLCAKINDLKKSGCRVILLWPSAVNKIYLDNREALKNLESALAEKSVYFECRPELFAHEEAGLFDSDYHVRYPGVVKNTTNLINLLKSKNL